MTPTAAGEEGFIEEEKKKKRGGVLGYLLRRAYQKMGGFPVATNPKAAIGGPTRASVASSFSVGKSGANV